MPDAVLMSQGTEHLKAEVSLAGQTGRWSAGRKACLLELIRRGALTVADACERYDLSADEVAAWRSAEGAHGREGLKTTKLQEVSRG